MNPETPDGDDQQSPRVNAIFDRLSARVDPPTNDWQSALDAMGERPADHGQPPAPRYQVHPAAEIFPMLDEDVLADLAEDIAMHGLREPVYLFRDPQMGEVLLDGRNRLAACEMLGIEPATRFFEGPDPLEFVLSQNLHRRHLSAGQRAAIAEQMKPLFEREAKERKRKSGGVHGRGQEKVSVKKSEPIASAKSGREATAGKASERVAKAVGISSSTVEKFARVKRADPGLAKQVASGEVPLGRADQVIRARGREQRDPAPAAPAAREFQPVDLHSPIAIVCAGPGWSGQLPMNVPMPAIAGQAVAGIAIVVDPRRFNKAQAYLRKALALHPSVTVRPKPTRALPAADATADPDAASTLPAAAAEPTPAERAAAADAYRRARDGG